jgi:hypothetical protein
MQLARPVEAGIAPDNRSERNSMPASLNRALIKRSTATLSVIAAIASTAAISTALTDQSATAATGQRSQQSAQHNACHQRHHHDPPSNAGHGLNP